MVSVPKEKKFVPPVGQYETSYDWRTRRPEINQRLSKAKVNSYVDQIFNKAKSPEKSSPSPDRYNKAKSWHRTDKGKRVAGTIKFNEARTTFVVERESLADLTPGFKYNAPPIVSSLKPLNWSLGII